MGDVKSHTFNKICNSYYLLKRSGEFQAFLAKPRSNCAAPCFLSLHADHPSVPANFKLSSPSHAQTVQPSAFYHFMLTTQAFRRISSFPRQATLKLCSPLLFITHDSIVERPH